MPKNDPFPLQIKRERELRGWSQQKMADEVRCDKKTLARWEKGETRPTSLSRERLCELLGKDAEELGLLDKPEKTSVLSPALSDRCESLEDMPGTSGLCGRNEESKQLRHWIGEEHCRLVAILGMGGMGKSMLAAQVVEATRQDFTCIFWYSLKNAPPLPTFLLSFLHFIDPQLQQNIPSTLDEQISILLRHLHQKRYLLILDNFEMLFQPGEHVGKYRVGYENYGELVKRLSEVSHKSCVLLTSRETPAELVALEDLTGQVRLLHLKGLLHEDSRKLLKNRSLQGSEEQWKELIQSYVGNPLALKLVASSISDLFAKQIGDFLQTQAFVLEDINNLLHQHFQRLSSLELEVMYWLAIEREACSWETLQANLLKVPLKGKLSSTLQSLKRRALIEALDKQQRFFLQPVILEYVTNDLVQMAYAEFQVFTRHTILPPSWQDFAFSQALARDYVREAQIYLILTPLAQQLLSFAGHAVLQEQCTRLLDQQRQQNRPQTYLASNVLNLLTHLHFDLRGFNYSELSVRQAYLQNVHLPDTSFVRSTFKDTAFTNTLGPILSLAIHPSDQLFAAGTATGEVWLAQIADGVPLHTYHGHIDGVWALAFSPDGRLLASSSDDGTVRVWNVETRQLHLLFTQHSKRVRAVAFSPDGRTIASGSNDKLIYLWNASNGDLLRTLEGHEDWVWSVAFDPSGHMLASGSADQTIRLWDLTQTSSDDCLYTFPDHTDRVRAVTFHPSGQVLASAGDDDAVRLWDLSERRCLHTLKGHTNRVWSIAFSRDGTLLASGSEDCSVRLWDTATAQCRATLPLHTHGVRAVAFDPSDLLVSGGDDQTIRLCESQTGSSLKTFQGYSQRIWSLTFAPTSGQLITCYEDQNLRIWDIQTGSPLRAIPTFHHGIRAISASPVAPWLAGVGEDEQVHLWSLETGRLIRHFKGHTNWLRTVVFSPNGQCLASGGEDQKIFLWDVQTGEPRWSTEASQSWIRALAFHPNNQVLASGSDDLLIRLWDTATGTCLQEFTGHTSNIRALAFHPTKPLLLSASEDKTIRLWDTNTRECLQTLTAHTHRVLWLSLDATGDFLVSCGDDLTIRLWDLNNFSFRTIERAHENRIRGVVYNPDGTLLASCSDDGKIKLWNVSTLAFQKELISERPYERMNITGALGLTEAQKANLRVLGAIEE
jgi:WD40 repeat protein/transcriptional regulator with XRE-family HTH domain